MRVLVVAEGSRSESLAQRLWDAGHEVSASGTQGLSLSVMRGRPELLVVELASDESGSLRRVIERARATSQWRLPALLLLPESSYWLRSALPVELMPARALPASDADGQSLRQALSALVALDGPRAPSSSAGGTLQLDQQERLVAGPEGSARLTGSETRLLAMLLEGGGAVVTAERLAGVCGAGRRSIATCAGLSARTRTRCAGSCARPGSARRSSRFRGLATG